jgi:hypothetical protein
MGGVMLRKLFANVTVIASFGLLLLRVSSQIKF